MQTICESQESFDLYGTIARDCAGHRMIAKLRGSSGSDFTVVGKNDGGGITDDNGRRWPYAEYVIVRFL